MRSAFVKRLIGEWQRNLRNNRKDRPSRRIGDICIQAESMESMDRETPVRVKESRISTVEKHAITKVGGTDAIRNLV